MRLAMRTVLPVLPIVLVLLCSPASGQDCCQRSHGAVVREDSSVRSLYLVFTGHEYADGGEVIRQALSHQHVPASFFFTGDFYRDTAHASLIWGLRLDGHYLGAHSDKHLLYAAWENRDSLLVRRPQFAADLRRNYGAMEVFGICRKDAPVFLPPYEWYNDSIAAWTRAEGLILVNFTPGTLSNADYTVPAMGSRYISSDSIYRRILSHEQMSPSGLNGFILLLHIGTHPARADKFYHRLDDLLSELKRRGYSFKRFSCQ
jgi:endoglucanase